MYLINCFFISSIIGFIFEGLFTLITKNHFSSGILYGPWTPIYGFGAILTIVISNKIFKKMHKNRITETIVTFFVLLVVLTFIEWLGGIIIEKIFDKTLWNYKNYKYNLGKYITLEMSLIWGITSILLIYLIKPLIDKLIKHIPKILTIFLYMPVEISKQLKLNRNEPVDGHEKDQNYLQNSEKAYIELSNIYDFVTINCSTKGHPKDIETINDKLYQIVKPLLHKR